ncbi:TM0106 family RecB-like putative nuclease [uncultured Ilumatobacter sp.]|jgi:predicted RecB family nuclease|uniref:TM0106 family RecB-like putative nuclease n=1 Tax=uncultured Ilumatobacter sp. TaxID=879968 RepID=UPI00374E2871|tara:strand:+ start:1355 stop:3070 length:1716 start_codon:yes stop_codon:yes gene_type:complete
MTRIDRQMLGAYAAKQCPFRLFRENDPTEPAVAAEPDEALQELFDDGITFEADIVAELVEQFGANVCEVPARGAASHDERRAITDTALAAGTPIILGALMQPDVDAGRLGEIDLLLASGDVMPSGAAVYLAIDVKSHRCTSNLGDGDDPIGPVHDLNLLAPAVIPGLSPKYREDDCLQLAHYHRLLQAHGHSPADDPSVPIYGGILGSERVVAWFDLGTPRFGTVTPLVAEGADGTANISFHKRQRSTARTALDRYDYEFAFRHRIVAAARARVDRATPPPVLPVSTKECERCPWRDPCRSDLEAADDVSLVNGVNYPEWRVHRHVGVTTATDLAALTPGEIEDRYADTPLTKKTVTKQVQHAQAAVAGHPIVTPSWDPAAIPRGDIEIDLDLENADFVYLWGARLTRVPSSWPEETGTYVPFVSFDPLDAVGERQLVDALWTWLNELRQRAAAEGLDLRVYSYSAIEATKLRQIGQSSEISDFLASDQWVDLLPFMRAKFWTNDGHGLKVMARASGFEWRDEDPGGYASIGWYNDALGGVDRAANVDRILQYNEDDCAATAALRSPRSSG